MKLAGGSGGERTGIVVFAAGVSAGVAGVWLYSRWRRASQESSNVLPYEPYALVRKKSVAKIPPELLVTAQAAEAAKQQQIPTEMLVPLRLAQACRTREQASEKEERRDGSL